MTSETSLWPVKIFEACEAGATDSWVWQVWLSAAPDGSYCAELIQVPWEDGVEAAVKVLASFREGQVLFGFLNESWLIDHEDALDEGAWMEIVNAVRALNSRLAKELHEAWLESIYGSTQERATDENSVADCVKSATWQRKEKSGGGAKWASIAESQRGKAAIDFFVRRYLKRYGKLPAGQHHVRVTFGQIDSGADCPLTPWMGGDGVFDDLVSFPERCTKGLLPLPRHSQRATRRAILSVRPQEDPPESINPYRRPGAPMCMTPLLDEADRLFPVDLPIPSPSSSPGGAPSSPESHGTSGQSPASTDEATPAKSSTLSKNQVRAPDPMQPAIDAIEEFLKDPSRAARPPE